MFGAAPNCGNRGLLNVKAIVFVPEARSALIISCRVRSTRYGLPVKG
jgi:hypothetical protein